MTVEISQYGERLGFQALVYPNRYDKTSPDQEALIGMSLKILNALGSRVLYACIDTDDGSFSVRARFFDGEGFGYTDQAIGEAYDQFFPSDNF